MVDSLFFIRIVQSKDTGRRPFELTKGHNGNGDTYNYLTQ